MANVLMTDELTIKVKFGEEEADIRVCYGDYFKLVYEKAFEAFGIPALDAVKYGLYEKTGEKLPKSAQIYNNAEISDGAVVEMRAR